MGRVSTPMTEFIRNRGPEPLREAPYTLAQPSLDDRATAALGLRMALYPSILGQWKVENSYDFDQLQLFPRPLGALPAFLRIVEGTPTHLRLLQMGAVSRVFALHAGGLEALTPVATLPTLFTEPLRVFAVPHPLPRAYMVAGARIADGDAAWAALADPAFDPSREVILTDGRAECRPFEDACACSTRGRSAPLRGRRRPRRCVVMVDAHDEGGGAGIPTPVRREHRLPCHRRSRRAPHRHVHLSPGAVGVGRHVLLSALGARRHGHVIALSRSSGVRRMSRQAGHRLTASAVITSVVESVPSTAGQVPGMTSQSRVERRRLTLAAAVLRQQSSSADAPLSGPWALVIVSPRGRPGRVYSGDLHPVPLSMPGPGDCSRRAASLGIPASFSAPATNPRTVLPTTETACRRNVVVVSRMVLLSAIHRCRRVPPRAAPGDVTHGAFVAGATWLGSGPLLSLVTLGHHLIGAAWIPWVLATSDAAAVSRRARDSMIAGVVLAIQILAGSPDMSALAVVLVMANVLRHVDWSGWGGRNNLRLVLSALLMLVLGFGLSAAQWIPTLELAARASRLGQPERVRTCWSTHPPTSER